MFGKQSLGTDNDVVMKYGEHQVPLIRAPLGPLPPPKLRGLLTPGPGLSVSPGHREGHHLRVVNTGVDRLNELREVIVGRGAQREPRRP